MTRFAASMAFLRGIMLLVAGLVALFAPAQALSVLILVGGGLLVADGVLGLAALDYAAARRWPFWLAVVRSGLAIIAGLVLLFSFYLTTILPLPVLTNLVAVWAIAIGLIEIVLILRDRAAHVSVWTALAGAALYVAIGLVLLVVPFASASILMQVGGAILAVFAMLHLLHTWRAIRAGSPVQARR